MQRYESHPRDDEEALARRMLELAQEWPRFGYRRIGQSLRREQWQASDTRVYRLRGREGLKVPQKRRKPRLLGTSENGCQFRQAEHPDHVWCSDFAFDRTESGVTLKWLSIMDEYTRECLTLNVDRSITSEDVIDTLAELFAMRGVPHRFLVAPEVAPAIGARRHREVDAPYNLLPFFGQDCLTKSFPEADD